MTNKFIAIQNLVGQVFIGKVKEETEQFYALENALSIIIDPNSGQPAFTMPSPFAETQKTGIDIKVSKAGIMEFPLNKQLIEAYDKITSVITIASASTIIDLNSRKK